MIKKFPANSRHEMNHGWLKTHLSFSFAEYHDPENESFGPLRVLNDDVVAPLRGFGKHPHQEMEIVSIVLSGQLQHEDSQGNKATTTFGEIQRMSAGTGIYHSEVNPSSEEDVNFLQLWFFPKEQGVTPSYEKTAFDIGAMKNHLLPVVDNHPDNSKVAHINQDLTIYLADLESDHAITFTQDKDRKTLIFVIEGELLLNGNTTLNKRDSARIVDVTSLNIHGVGQSRFMLIDLPA
ncbi:pirin family protein [Cytobacillus sp. Hm23]